MSYFLYRTFLSICDNRFSTSTMTLLNVTNFLRVGDLILLIPELHNESRIINGVLNDTVIIN